jgi:hypothetical protein
MSQNLKYHETQTYEIDIITRQLNKISDDMKSIRDMQTENADRSALDDCCEKIQRATITSRDFTAEISLLSSLRFKSMKVRHSQIAVAHQKTFTWILEAPELPPTDSRYHIKFSDWLRSGSGIYWISGKPGSGKSTLMKLLCSHATTRSFLKEWAGPCKLIQASYFFWSSGTYMQKSQQGLLQSLLYEILSQSPALFQKACPEKWAVAMANAQAVHEWSLADLFQAFSFLTEQGMSDTRFCFFIDGLDEYDGDHFDIIEAVEMLASSPNVKICLSSRPWNPFENAFGRHLWKKLYLQELSRTDIELYVQNKLTEHSSFAMFSLEDPRADDLVREIVQKAQGVFLWVFLAIRDLKQGLTNEDPIELLQSRLHRMPAELEPFFRHMLEKIDDIYLPKMSSFFQVALSSSGPLPLLVYSFLDENNWDFALQLDVAPLSRKELVYRLRKITRRINSRCQGLLDISGFRPRIKPWLRRAAAHGGFFFEVSEIGGGFEEDSKSDGSDEDQQDAQTDEHGPQVDFLHRTVRDYLKTKEMLALLTKHTPPNFNPHAALSRAFLARIKTVKTTPVPVKILFGGAGEVEIQQGVELKVVTPIWNKIFRHSQLLEEEAGETDEEMFDELSQVRKTLVISDLENKVYWHQQSPAVMDTALQYGLKDLLSRKLRSDPRRSYPTDGLRIPLLYTALFSADSQPFDRNLAMVRLLLEHGADANAKWNGSTVSALFLHQVCKHWEMRVRGNLRRHTHELIFLLLEYGADPNGYVDNKSVLGLYLLTICQDQISDIINRARLEIVHTLLESDADPNGVFEQGTVWERFLETISDPSHPGSGMEFGLIKLMLKHGAKRDIHIQQRSLKHILESKFSGRWEGYDFADYLQVRDRAGKSRRCCGFFFSCI